MSDIKKIRTTWDEKEEKWYFSVQDVVEILTDTVDAKDYIKKMKKRDPQLNFNWGTICPPVEMVAADGKKHKVQVANARKALEQETGESVVSGDNYLPEKQKSQQLKKKVKDNKS